MYRNSRSGKVLQVFLILVACTATLCAAYFLPMLGPKDTRRQINPAQEQSEIVQLDTKSQELWERFNSVRNYKKVLDPEDVALLKEALDMRDEFVRRNPNRNDPKAIIDEMREQWQRLMADESRKKSFELEAVANIARDKKEYTDAAKTYAEALALEEQIGEIYPLSKRKDFGRIERLRTQLRLMEATPIHTAALALEQEADALAEKKEWGEAAKKYKDAYEKGEVLRLKYLALLPMETARPNRLLTKLDTVQSTDENEKILASIAEANQLAEAGKTGDAELRWNDALARYDDLAKLYPRSKHLQKNVLEALRKTRDLTLAAPLVAAFEKGLLSLDENIRSGKIDEVSGQVLLLRQEAERIQKKYPAVVISQDTHSKLSFVSLKSSDIPLVQNRFLVLLKTLPGNPRLQLMYSEVPQVLYVAIMDNKNPSQRPGDTLPVDSVSYDDATDFCQRLSWLTGRIVRLPTEKEFRAALGEVDGTEATLAAQVWSIENSNDTTHPVATSKPNAHGFHDLLGNVSEWLQAPDAAGTAKEIGGNYQTIREMLVAVPVGEIIKRDKSRLRGFRVLAETAAPPSVP